MLKYRLAVLTSHPVQYQTPLFRKLANHPGIDLSVYFCWDFGVKESIDPEFGKKLKWDIPLLEGYRYTFLRNVSPRPSSQFWGQINPGIIRELRQHHCDSILIFGWNSLTNWLAFFTAFLSGIPVLLRGENPLHQELLKPTWKTSIKKIYLGWLFRHVDAFLYLGEENKRFYEHYGVPQEKLFFVPYAVDNKRFMLAHKELRSKKYALRKEERINKDAVVILFVGKLIEKKHPFDLLKAYELLITRYQLPVANVALLFVGDGVLHPALERYVREHNIPNVRFVGFKNQTELPRYYALADVLVLPSGKGETWGLVVNEAMCFELPVIVSDVVGSGPDLIRNDENGYIFPLGNIEKLSMYLKELITSASKRKNFGKRSLGVIRGYSYEKDAEGILEALGSLKK